MNSEIEFTREYSDIEEKIISEEFNRVKKHVYLDHAGTTLYSETQIHDVFKNLSSNLYCNPHTSKSTEDLIDQVRFRILKHFNTTSDEYSIIFTSGATQSLKIVAETFDFQNNGVFCYLQDNHTSVLGLREVVGTTAIEVINKPVLMEHMSSDFQHDQSILKQNNSLFVYPRTTKKYEKFAKWQFYFTSDLIPNNSNNLRKTWNFYPAQCNFSGFKYPLDLITKIQRNGISKINSSNWYVCIDAASFVATNFLDLKRYSPDFVCLSFYKIFGYPTGLGAIIVSKRGSEALRKKYYGGGTVKIAMSEVNWHRKRDCLHERFEDGSLPFLSIISLLNGFNTLERLVKPVGKLNSMTRISRHCFNLGKYLYKNLKNLKYSNGQPVVKLYHDTDFESIEDQGGIVNFNLLHEDGSFIGFAETSAIATIYDIYLRTGCFCNPGACQRHLNLSNDDLKKHYKAGHVCGDSNHLIDGVPTGSVRISVGYMTTIDDVDAVIHMVTDCYLKKNPKKLLNPNEITSNYKVDPKSHQSPTSNHVDHNQFVSYEVFDRKMNNWINEIDTKEPIVTINEIKPIQSVGPITKVKLKQICVYPIKSCGAFKISTKWPLTSRGLKFDREWMIVKSNGVALTQKADTKLCLITPSINVDEGCLEISFPYMQSIKVPLNRTEGDERILSSLCQSKVCGDRIEGIDCGDDVAHWLSDALCTNGLRLIRQSQLDKRKFKDSQSISLSNQAQFLLINTTTVQWLMNKVEDWHCLTDRNDHLVNVVDRFRGNLIVEAPDVSEELLWKYFRVGQVMLKGGEPCTRCQMICIDQRTGDKTAEPLRTIAKEFQGKIKFGLYLGQTKTSDESQYINCDSSVTVEK